MKLPSLKLYVLCFAFSFSMIGCFGDDVSKCPLIMNKPCQNISYDDIMTCLENGSYPKVNDITIDFTKLLSTTSVEQRSPSSINPDSINTSGEASSIQDLMRESVCPWTTYNQGYNNTIPRVIAHAVCNSTIQYSYGTNQVSGETRDVYYCSEIIYPVNVLKWTCDGEHLGWTMETEYVVIGCGLAQ